MSKTERDLRRGHIVSGAEAIVTRRVVMEGTRIPSAKPTGEGDLALWRQTSLPSLYVLSIIPFCSSIVNLRVVPNSRVSKYTAVKINGEITKVLIAEGRSIFLNATS